MKRRWLGILLTICMVLTLLPTAAWAEGETGTVEVSTAEGLTAAVSAGGYIKLMDNITINGDLDVDSSVMLDLNNYKLNAGCIRIGYGMKSDVVFAAKGGTIDVPVNNTAAGIIRGGTFSGYVLNNNVISGGTFRGTVENFRIGAREYTGSQITGGDFYGEVLNGSSYESSSHPGTITDGSFHAKVTNMHHGMISGGDFYGEVVNNADVNELFTGITGGTFYGDLTGTPVNGLTVTYYDGINTEPCAIQVVQTNGTASEPAVPTKAGYTFDGWEPTIPTTITENLTVKAKWTIKPCICEASCFPAGNAACPRCCDNNKLCELFKAPTDGSAFSNGDVIPVRWGLYANIQTGDTISLDLLNEAGEKLSNWTSDKTTELNPSLHSANLLLSLSDPGRYTLRCTLNRAGTDGSTQEVIRWETSLLLNGAAVFAKDKSIEYLSGMTVDVSELFLFAHHTSSNDKISYTVTGGTGEGTLVENMLSITKPGTFSITATVDRDPGSQWEPKQDSDTAILTVNAFSITYDLDGGEVSGNPDYYSSKTPTFTLNAPTKSGYTFIGWSGTDLDGNENKTVTVTIGSTGDRTYTAHWTRNSSGGGGGGTTTYTLTFDTNGGSALSALRLARGSTVDLAQYVPERSGHVFTGWYADAALTQPVESVTLTASTTVYAGWRAETGELPFTDVGADAWYRDDVQYVYDKGLMTGMTADRFAPNEGMTRAMLVTVLWRQAGSPVVNYAMDFSDVAEGAWYAEAVRWAAAEGVVGGYGDGRFGPDDPITREQLATILFRHLVGDGPVELADWLRPYADADRISGYAAPAMQWAVGHGVLKGDGDQLDPQGTATRAQVAAMLHRALEL